MLYGEALCYTLERNTDRILMANLRTFFGPLLVLKRCGGMLGETVDANSDGYSNLVFTPDGLTELYALDPPDHTSPIRKVKVEYKEYLLKTMDSKPHNSIRRRLQVQCKCNAV
eukprot:gene17713-24072_t